MRTTAGSGGQRLTRERQVELGMQLDARPGSDPWIQRAYDLGYRVEEVAGEGMWAVTLYDWECRGATILECRSRTTAVDAMVEHARHGGQWFC